MPQKSFYFMFLGTANNEVEHRQSEQMREWENVNIKRPDDVPHWRRKELLNQAGD